QWATCLVLTTHPVTAACIAQAFAQQPAVLLPYTTLFRSSQSNVVVTATPSPAGATASSNTATTGTTGAATFSGLTLSGTVGNYTLGVRTTGLPPRCHVLSALRPGAAASMARNGGGTSAPAGPALTP